MSAFTNARNAGYTVPQILNYVSQNNPAMAAHINTAINAGYTIDHVYNFLQKNESKFKNPAGNPSQNLYKRSQQSVHPSIKGAAKFAGTAALIGAGAYALGGTGQAGNQAIRASQILPPIPPLPPRAQGGTTLQGRSPQGPQPRGGGGLPAPQAPAQIGYNPQSPQAQPPGPRGQPPAPTQPNAPIIPPYQHDPRTNVDLVRNIKEDSRIAQALNSGLSLPAVAQALRATLPRAKLALLDRAPGGFDQVLEDYAVSLGDQASEEVRQQALQKFNARRQPGLVEQETQRFEENYPQEGQQQPQEDPNQMQFEFDSNPLQEQATHQMQQPVQEINQGQKDQQANTSESQLPEVLGKTNNRLDEILNNQKSEKKDREKEIKLQRLGHKISDQIDKFINMDLPENAKFIRPIIEEAISKGLSKEDIQQQIMRNIFQFQGVPETDDQKDYYNYLFGKIFGKKEETKQEIQKIIQAPVSSELKDISKTIVITPLGAAEIKHDGKAGKIVKTDKGEKSFPHEDIEEVPEDVIQAVSNILDIPEVDRSSNIALFLYNPADKEMYFQFHDGSAYKYYDIDPDKVFRLAEKMHIPITSGQNVYGAWSPEDKKSLGASFYQEILKDPKYKKPKKGEPENPNYRKMETMYDYWEKLRKKPRAKKVKE